MFSNKSLDSITEIASKYYRFLPIILYLLYGLIFLGLVYINPEYLHTFKLIMQLFVCLFLIYRFHPYRTHTLRKYDSQIIFSSAMFLLVNTGMVEIAYNLLSPLDKMIHKV